MNTNDKKEVWRAAYNAAMTGFLASDREIAKATIRAGCVDLADRALEDFEAKWHSKDNEPAEVRIATAGQSRPLGGVLRSE